MPCFRLHDGGLDLLVWVAPRAARPGLGPMHGDRLRAAVSAPPVDGAANEALRRLVAESLEVARSEVSVVAGATGRNKTVRISGDGAALLSRLQSLGIPLQAAEADGDSRKR